MIDECSVTSSEIVNDFTSDNEVEIVDNEVEIVDNQNDNSYKFIFLLNGSLFILILGIIMIIMILR
tara:strand:+ start:49 stop:246 length:198 start_codon:yes stop_codon:yes gene_type:complete